MVVQKILAKVKSFYQFHDYISNFKKPWLKPVEVLSRRFTHNYANMYIVDRKDDKKKLQFFSNLYHRFTTDHNQDLVNGKTTFFLYLSPKLRCLQFIILDWYVYVVNRFFDLRSYLTENSQFQLQITINSLCCLWCVILWLK